MTTKWHHHNLVPSHHHWNYLIGTGVEITVPPPPMPLTNTTTTTYLDTNTSHTTAGPLCMCEQGILCNTKNLSSSSSLSSTTTLKPIHLGGMGGGGGVGGHNGGGNGTAANSYSSPSATVSSTTNNPNASTPNSMVAGQSGGTSDIKIFSKQGWWCFVISLPLILKYFIIYKKKKKNLNDFPYTKISIILINY